MKHIIQRLRINVFFQDQRVYEIISLTIFIIFDYLSNPRLSLFWDVFVGGGPLRGLDPLESPLDSPC